MWSKARQIWRQEGEAQPLRGAALFVRAGQVFMKASTIVAIAQCFHELLDPAEASGDEAGRAKDLEVNIYKVSGTIVRKRWPLRVRAVLLGKKPASFDTPTVTKHDDGAAVFGQSGRLQDYNEGECVVFSLLEDVSDNRNSSGANQSRRGAIADGGRGGQLGQEALSASAKERIVARALLPAKAFVQAEGFEGFVDLQSNTVAAKQLAGKLYIKVLKVPKRPLVRGGVLSVRIISASKLRYLGATRSSTCRIKNVLPEASVTISAGGRFHETGASSASRDPVWGAEDSAEATFNLRPSENNRMVKFEVFSSLDGGTNESLGFAQLEVPDIIPGQTTELALPLWHPDTEVPLRSGAMLMVEVGYELGTPPETPARDPRRWDHWMSMAQSVSESLEPPTQAAEPGKAVRLARSFVKALRACRALLDIAEELAHVPSFKSETEPPMPTTPRPAETVKPVAPRLATLERSRRGVPRGDMALPNTPSGAGLSPAVTASSIDSPVAMRTPGASAGPMLSTVGLSSRAPAATAEQAFASPRKRFGTSELSAELAQAAGDVADHRGDLPRTPGRGRKWFGTGEIFAEIAQAACDAAGHPGMLPRTPAAAGEAAGYPGILPRAHAAASDAAGHPGMLLRTPAAAGEAAGNKGMLPRTPAAAGEAAGYPGMLPRTRAAAGEAAGHPGTQPRTPGRGRGRKRFGTRDVSAELAGDVLDHHGTDRAAQLLSANVAGVRDGGSALHHGHPMDILAGDSLSEMLLRSPQRMASMGSRARADSHSSNGSSAAEVQEDNWPETLRTPRGARGGVMGDCAGEQDSAGCTFEHEQAVSKARSRALSMGVAQTPSDSPYPMRGHTSEDHASDLHDFPAMASSVSVRLHRLEGRRNSCVGTPPPLSASVLEALQRLEAVAESIKRTDSDSVEKMEEMMRQADRLLSASSAEASTVLRHLKEMLAQLSNRVGGDLLLQGTLAKLVDIDMMERRLSYATAAAARRFGLGSSCDDDSEEQDIGAHEALVTPRTNKAALQGKSDASLVSRLPALSGVGEDVESLDSDWPEAAGAAVRQTLSLALPRLSPAATKLLGRGKRQEQDIVVGFWRKGVSGWVCDQIVGSVDEGKTVPGLPGGRLLREVRALGRVIASPPPSASRLERPLPKNFLATAELASRRRCR